MKSALVIGASRGIGRQIAITLSKNNYKVGVAAKSIQSTEELPGSIYTVTKEIEDLGGTALPIQCNVRNEDEINNAVQTCLEQFGGLDFAVYNAGAVVWAKVKNTPMKRFNLLTEVNLKGSFCMIQNVLPHFLEEKKGKILMISPPFYNKFFRGKTPYAATKVGMTVLTKGLATELKGTGVSVTSLWPATPIGSFVMQKLNVPAPLYRTPEIIADAALVIGEEPSNKYNGRALIDEDLLKSVGVTDLSKYRGHPDYEPQRSMPDNVPSLRLDDSDENPLMYPL